MSHIICPHLNTIYFLYFEHTILIWRNDEGRVNKKIIFGKNTLLTIDVAKSREGVEGGLCTVLNK
ncbi:hypothetical protein CN488_16985 [Bacillus anthracis]|nr:hypothetical protein CN488_16985 [Bacillus anthracis]